MKKPFFGIIVVFCVLSLSVCRQAFNKSQYRAIDPFDYKLDERNAKRGAVRKFKSVVQYVSQNGTVLSFVSLDQGTTLNLTITRHFTPPVPGQKAAIFYTATKRVIDALVLDDIDESITTEEEINLEKSEIPVSSGINKADYREIDPFDYKIEAEHARHGDVRKYKSAVQFLVRDGITYYFISHAAGTPLSMKATQRFPPLAADQRVIIYYTAAKGVVDSLSLDDIEF